MEAELQYVRTTLICGFLGAGKTTFIRANLQDSRQKTAVLVNEFGPLAMDGAIIQKIEDLHVVEMAGGCICCSQKLKLAETITEIIRRFQPERLFIEPSGVAEASEVIKVLTKLTLQDQIQLDGVLTIVDAETFLEYSEPDAFGTFFLDQVCNADMILVNKGDLVPDKQLQTIMVRVQALNSTALILPTSFCQLSAPLPEGRNRPLSCYAQQPHAWEYVYLKPSAPLPEQRVHELMELMDNGAFGRILRAKGVLLTKGKKQLQLQRVGNRWIIEKQENFISPRLTCIGFNLDRNRLATFFTDQDFSTTPSYYL